MSASSTKLDKTEVITWMIRIGSFLMSVAITVSSWFLNQAWTRINEAERNIQENRLKLSTLEATRYTAADWSVNKTLLDSERLEMDRRIMRLEESYPVIKESLLEIKNSINETRK